jgi:hypothetical protein
MERNPDPELHNLLKEWQAPAPSASMENRVLSSRRSWIHLLLSGYVRVPIPVAACLVVAIAAGGWRLSRPVVPPAPKIVVKSERVEVPVIRERVVTKLVYRDRPAPLPENDHSLTLDKQPLSNTHFLNAGLPKGDHVLTFDELRPVTELRPTVIRSGSAQN